MKTTLPYRRFDPKRDAAAIRAVADRLIAESEGRAPHPNEPVWDMFRDAQPLCQPRPKAVR